MNRDIQAALLVQKMKTNGGYSKLSYSQITCLIVNMTDAKENLESPVFERVLKLFYKLRADKKRIKMNIDGYYAVSIDIIKQFNAIAPYEKYSGDVNENTTIDLLNFMNSSDGIAFYERNIRIVKAQKYRQNIIVRVIAAAAVLAIVAFGFYVYEVTILFDGSPGLYYAKLEGFETVIKFTDKSHFSIYVMYFEDDSDVAQAYGVSKFVYSGHEWKRLIGQLYLPENQLLPIKYVENGITRSTVSMKCTDSFMYDWWGNDLTDGEEVDEETYRIIIDMLDTGTMIMDGLLYEPIEKFPEEMQPYVDMLPE